MDISQTLHVDVDILIARFILFLVDVKAINLPETDIQLIMDHLLTSITRKCSVRRSTLLSVA